MTPQERLTAFRIDLPLRQVPELVQRHITFGDCYALTEDRYFELKAEVSRHFSVHTSQIVVVGSAKLGFSIAPQKRYREFGERSDIDVAIASSELFDLMWQDVFDFWRRGEFWQGLDDFRRYHFRGWMRPDKLPPAESFALSKEWWEFFRQLTSSGRFGYYKITGALYKNWHFLESYQEKCMRDCQEFEAS